MTAERQLEQDFPPGHPARFDFDPNSTAAQEWARVNVSPKGERAFPVDHPGALDTAGNLTRVTYAPGVDPFNPHREAFTGRTPEQAEGVRQISEMASRAAKESPVLKPIDGVAFGEALDAKRKATGHDVLNAEEYSQVLSEFHGATKPAGE